MRCFGLFIVFLLAMVLGLVVFSDAKAEWDHTVIMNAEPGSSYNVIIPTPRACIYVTDCTEQIGNQETPTAPKPPVVSDIPTPAGTYGWSFYDPIDRSTWIITGDSQEVSTSGRVEQYKVEHLIDDLDTEWHTPWVTPIPHPHWVIVDMQTEHWVDSMIILPRKYDETKSWSVNSNPKDYEVWVSTDNSIWARVADGTLDFTPVDEAQTIKFLIPNLVRYVKFVTLSSTEDAPAVVFRDLKITESTKDIVITGGGV